MRNTDELLSGLARVRDRELAGRASTAGARTLLASITSAPVSASPGRGEVLAAATGTEGAVIAPARRGQAPALPAATGTETAAAPASRRPWRIRLAAGAAAAGLLTAGVVAGPGLLGGGSAAGYANSAVDIARDGDQYVARIKDPFAEYRMYTEAFRAVGLDIDLRPVPVSPTAVGKILGMVIADHSPPGTGPKVEAGPSGPLVDGVALTMETLPKNCRPGRDAGCVMVLRIPVGFPGDVLVRLGREARPGEEYANFEAATAPGEMLAGVKLRKGRPVDDVLAQVRGRNLTAVFSLVKVDGKTGGLSFEPLPARTVGGDWTVWNAWQVKAGVVRLLVTPERLPENPFFNGSAPPPALS
ncbi:hypothetical protein DQ384_01235 [Sphaerisporangium album]|uniref:Uncharacterized protein n=1 Tax=Sphaerisporangium album TaxID=509200 RepID=A0A367FRQ4_9ACTN|nr:hypothetical protein [Sphaerisporangium album]RCG33096.1 hypothetical protein DQ384_01235 [Sphaerisporangium album]